MDENLHAVERNDLAERLATLETIVRMIATNLYYGGGIPVGSSEESVLRSFVGLEGE